MLSFEDLHAKLEAKAPGESISFPTCEMPELPAEFESTVWGTPLWIAHPGATAQYRAYPALHAYRLSGRFKIHRDEFDPHDHPLLHTLFDAPEVALAAIAAAITGFLAWLFLERREKAKNEEDRHWWLPALAALAVAAIVGVFVYIFGAMVRVAFHSS